MGIWSRIKDDAAKTWALADGKLSSVKSPALRLAIIIAVILLGVKLLMLFLPAVITFVILAGVIVVLFKAFTTSEEP